MVLLYAKCDLCYKVQLALTRKIKMNPVTTTIPASSRRAKSNKSIPATLALALILLMVAGNVCAMEITEWRFQTSLVTKHWDPDPEHVDHSKLISFEFETDNRWLYGFAHFDNSFGQPSQYVYTGYTWPLFGQDRIYFKLTGGLLHGYKHPHKHKIPLNGLGVAPAIVPAFGFKYKRVFTELQILGTAAITWTAGFNFGHKKD